jgi:hypothetical protein
MVSGIQCDDALKNHVNNQIGYVFFKDVYRHWQCSCYSCECIREKNLSPQQLRISDNMKIIKNSFDLTGDMWNPTEAEIKLLSTAHILSDLVVTMKYQEGMDNEGGLIFSDITICKRSED